MKIKYLMFCLFALILLASLNTCFPTYRAVKINPDTVGTGLFKNLPAKIFTTGNRIFLFPDGFEIDSGYIKGEGTIGNYDLSESKHKNIRFPVDSITAMTTYEETHKSSRFFGSCLFTVTAAPLLVIGIYCISCPKCCFGSCPTVYINDGKDYRLEAELFSECISKQLESNDIDLLKQNVDNDSLELKITNEALETHYINKFEVAVAMHPSGTELYPGISDSLLLFSSHSAPIGAVTKDGENITQLLSKDDNKYYRTGVSKISELKNGPVYDWIDIKVPSSGRSFTKMLLKYRNTLLSTTLLYDVVLGSQGAAGLSWTHRMNEDPVYASQFKMVYDAFSGIRIKLFENGSWKYLGKFKDAGPLNWKYIAAEIPSSGAGNTLIRLEFIPDNFMIDYITFDTTTPAGNYVNTETVYPAEIIGNGRNQTDSVLSYIKKDDRNYLKTDPGDCYYFTYKIPAGKNLVKTVLIYSKGYYNEWIRGSWINNKNYSYTFNLYDINGTLVHMAESWINNSELLEKEFFHSRFSLKEAK